MTQGQNAILSLTRGEKIEVPKCFTKKRKKLFRILTFIFTFLCLDSSSKLQNALHNNGTIKPLKISIHDTSIEDVQDVT